MDLLNLSRSRSRERWRRRNLPWRRLLPAEKPDQISARPSNQRWRFHYLARWLKSATCAVGAVATLMLVWDMAWTQGTLPQDDSQFITAVEQIEDVRRTELRALDENHPDIPDPGEPTTDSEWSELVEFSRQNRTDFPSSPDAEGP